MRDRGKNHSLKYKMSRGVVWGWFVTFLVLTILSWVTTIVLALTDQIIIGKALPGMIPTNYPCARSTCLASAFNPATGQNECLEEIWSAVQCEQYGTAAVSVSSVFTAVALGLLVTFLLVKGKK